MAKDRNGAMAEKDEKNPVRKNEDEEEGEMERKSTKSREISGSDLEEESRERRNGKSRRKARESSDSDGERRRRRRRKGRSRRRYSDEDSSSESESESKSESESELSCESERSGSGSESERRSRKRKEKRRRREKDEERERRRKRREKERRREREEERRKKEKGKKKKKEKRKEKKERGNKGAVTNSWGKYGIIRETDMWNKRPEFTAWLQEVKQVNLESLPNWEEKQMFKEFMEDHNTATFPSKKYYNLDAYFKNKMEKELKRGIKKVMDSERTVFNDEEQRRLELLREREKLKEQEVETLKRTMQGGMAQAMKEQAQLREEMAYQYKLGNFEAAAAIQRRLDPDVAM